MYQKHNTVAMCFLQSVENTVILLCYFGSFWWFVRSLEKINHIIPPDFCSSLYSNVRLGTSPGMIAWRMVVANLLHAGKNNTTTGSQRLPCRRPTRGTAFHAGQRNHRKPKAVDHGNLRPFPSPLNFSLWNCSPKGAPFEILHTLSIDATIYKSYL